jgi:hypothetical protein
MTVGRRLAEILTPDAVEPEPVRAMVGPEPVVDARERSIRNPTDVIDPVEPELPQEVAERIRALLREGDWQSAAAYAEMVMANIGVLGPDVRGGARATD